MTNKIKIKRSSVPDKIPDPGDLDYGELAINYSDGNLFFKNSANTVITIASTQFVDVAGNISGGNISVTGNVAAQNFIGNGAALTGITATIAPAGNSGAVQFNNSGVISGSDNFTFDGTSISIAGNVTAVGNISGAYILGNGSQLTGIQTVSSELINGSKTFSLNSDGTVDMPVVASMFDATQDYLLDDVHVLDEFDATVYRTAKYLVQATNIIVESSTEQVHSTEVLLTHNGANTFMTEYATLISGNALIELDSFIANGNATLSVTTLSANTTVDFYRVALIAGASVPPLNLEGDLMAQSGTEDLNVGEGAQDLQN